MKMSKLLISIASMMLILLVAACNFGATPAPVQESQVDEEESAEQAEASSMAGALPGTSGERFDGQTVVVVSVSGDQGEYLKKIVGPWEEQTGATVELNLIPFGELQDKVATAVAAGAFVGDVLNIPAYMGGDLMGNGFVEPVPDEVVARLDWNDIMPLYQQQTEWGGTTYGYPWDGDFHSMYYRKDLLDNPDYQAAFKDKYGYDLQAPQTWDQYGDVAQFFAEDVDEVTYGDVELIMRKNQGFHGFVSRATCYAKMPDNPAFFFDPDTMEAQINNPGFVKALEDLVAILPYAPPDMPNFGWIENVQTFVGGSAALDIQWADVGPMSLDPDMSVVQGKVGFDLSPGCSQTYDAQAGDWVEFPDINYAPYAAFGGWQNLVPTNAEAKQAAIDLAAFYASADVLKQASVTGGSGVNPARFSTVQDVDTWVDTGFAQEDAQDYLEMVEQVLGHPNAVFQLRLPGYVEYQDALELAVSKAIAGQATPQEALDEAAAEWNAITDRIGRDGQQALYQQSLASVQDASAAQTTGDGSGETTVVPGTSGERFDGQTVVVVSVSGDQGEYLKKIVGPWEEQTGATVELNLIPFGELQDKVATAVAAGAFVGDVLNIPAYMGGDLMGNGFVEPVPDEVVARLDWNDIMPLYQQQTEWGGTTYGYPWDGDFHSMYYRKDLLDNPDYQAAFKDKYGYDLQAPQTWDQYGDVAQFFAEDVDEVTYGDVELIMRKNQGFHGFVSRATCYAKMPDNPAFFFDPDTMEAQINNPGFVKALEDLVAILPYAPPDMPNFGWIENVQTFVGGSAALDIQWADVGPMSLDPDMSVVQGKVGFDLSPGCSQTYDAQAGDWVEFPDINYAPYAAFGGWQNLVPTNAEAKQAAIDLAAFYASADVLKQASVTGGSGVNPARFSTVQDVDTWVDTGFAQEDAQDYLEMVEQVLGHPNAVFQLRLPGYVQYQDALELAVSKAIAGQATPQEALDEAAAEWNSITDRIGRDSQQALYRKSLGLE